MHRASGLQLNDLLREAEKQPVKDRLTWLRAHCEDETLVRRVLEMLSGDDTATRHVVDTWDAASAEPMSGDLAGTLLGAWRLLRELGSGGMGSVWLAERADSAFQMKAAVKLIKNEAAGPDIIARFRRERQILADLKHPNISLLLDGGTTAEGMPYLVMEYVDGHVVDQWREERVVSPEELLLVFRQICLAVGYAHQRGVLHRDIKPQNIMITSDGMPKLMDFGIAGKKSEQDDGARRLMTPEYAPPETLVGGGKTRAADIYSLGLVLFFLITGKRPRSAFGKWDEEVRGLGEESGSELYADVADLLTRMLAADPGKRIRSAELVVCDIDRILADDRMRGNPDASPEHAHYDAMIWYHGENRIVVEDLARRLEDETGLKIWLDVWYMVPGEVQARALDAAYGHSACLLVIVGADDHQPWENVDERGALAHAWVSRKNRVVPVLLPGAPRPERESGMPPFLRRRTWATLDVAMGHEELELLARAVRGLPPGRSRAPAATDICPFRGLEVFREEDRRFYHGREALIQRLFDHLRKHRFLAVLGPSGSGKSSAVQAGLVPLLRARKAAVALFTPSQRPLEELAFALAPILYPQSEEGTCDPLLNQLVASDVGLLDALSTYREGPLCLVIDQFEEIFTLSSDAVRVARFVNALLLALENHDNLYVVLTMRSDFLGRCAALPDLNQYVGDNILQVESMTEEELARAVLEPARQVGLRFEEGLAERILEEVKGASSELPLMEHALLELYERRKGNLLTAQAFREIGGVEGALATRAETEFTRLDEESRGLLRKMFIHCLVQPGEGSEDTRRRATRGELLAEGTDKARIEALLNQWIDAHLLTSHYDARRKEDMVDVAHEALIRKWGRIHNWMEADRETARHLARIRRQARTWNENGRDPDLLLRGAPLLRTVDMLEHETLHLARLERDFVAAGVALREAEQEREEAMRRRELEVARGLAVRARLIAGVTLLGLLTVGLLAVRLYQIQKAETGKAHALTEVSDYLTDLFKVTAEEQDRGRRLTAKELVDRGAHDLETRLKDQGETRARLLGVLGLIYYNLADYEESLRLRLELYESVAVGDDYRERVLCGNAVVACYLELSRLEEARTLGRSCVALARDKLGPSAALAEAAYYLGVTYARMGDYKNSRPYLEESLRLRRKLLGETHPAVSDSLNELAGLMEVTEDLGEAEALYRTVLDARLKRYGPQHVLVAEAMGNLGGCLLAQYRLDEAETMMKDVLEMRKTLHGPDHPAVVDTLSNLGVIYQKEGRMAEAEAAYREVLALRRTSLGEDHPLFALSQANLGALMLRNGRLDAEVENLLLEALRNTRRALGDRHKRVAEVLYELGLFNQQKGRLEDAERYYQESLAIRRDAFGDTHQAVAHSLYQLGDLLAESGRYAEAGEMGRRAHAIYMAVYEENSVVELIARALVVQCDAGLPFERAERDLAVCWRRLVAQRGADYRLSRGVMRRLHDVCVRAGQTERAAYWIAEEEKAISNPEP